MSPSTVIVDYGMGNLRSVQKAFEICGEKARVSPSPRDLEKARRIILPGVGAFGEAMRRLKKLGLDRLIKKKINAGTPYLGICLGLQMLFESSEETPDQEGLGVFPGAVQRFRVKLKVPHIGWNEVETDPACPLFKGLGEKPYFYFVHSYFALPKERRYTAGATRYPKPFASAIWKDNVYATQFHPEKSQKNGLRVIQNFLDATA